MSDGGKGSSPRPYSVTYDQFLNNWDNIFGNKMKKKVIKLVNPLNQDIWYSEEYSTPVTTEGVEYIKVYKEETPDRKLLMRKDALKKLD